MDALDLARLIPDPIRRVCRPNYPAFHHQGERMQGSIRYIVLHATEGSSAKATAEWFMQPSSAGSSNLVVDDGTCYRTLGDNVIPWGAPPLNVHGFHIEQAGYTAWPRRRWLLHRRTIRRAAYKAALRCRWYGIPPKILTAQELRLDFGDEFQGNWLPGPLNGGIVTHATVSQAYHQSDHTDPGEGYPMNEFLRYLERFLKEMA